MNDNTFDSDVLSQKESIRRNIRDALTNKKSISYMTPDLTVPAFDAVEHPLTTFVSNFRKAGGKLIPCTNMTLMNLLDKLIKSQKYNTLLNTSPNLGALLTKRNISFVNAIDPFYPADAVLCFSDMLVARTGGIGFTQHANRYVSVKNLARDIIVVSRDVCIYPELEQAMADQKRRYGEVQPPMMEFLSPAPQDDLGGIEKPQPTNPLFILFLVSDAFAQSEAAHVTAAQKPVAETHPVTPVAHESQNQESAD
ncbi:MAG: hypothetical protein MJZ57_02415 [Bacteroidales bacterium]|nr:hypothetical protein [Bacteroidales bacterium]